MLRYFEKLGHFQAAIDPLNLPRTVPNVSAMRESNANQCLNTFESFGFTEADRKRKVKITIPNCGGVLGSLRGGKSEFDLGKYGAHVDNSAHKDVWEVGALYDRLMDIYCGPMGVEYLHILNRDKINWLRNEIETAAPFTYDKDQKKVMLERVVRAVSFEKFAGMKFATVKRFGLDGCEGVVVGLEQMLKVGAMTGVESAVLCMAHRGRLNVLFNIMKKPKDQIFSEFMGHTGFGTSKWGNAGDVKYHMGAEIKVHDDDLNRDILYTLLPNPSHLEAVDPVCLGTVKARQDLLVNHANVTPAEAHSKVVPIIIHGDASISGQGIVYETCQMTSLPKYGVGGTIHIVVNNQIGFTTNPSDGASGNYCTDVAKCVEAPVFHVNGDCPEAITRVMEVAMKYRQKFQSDVFINVVGYRRSGHNELDMPKFTQPNMYNIIEQRPSVMDLYGQQLIKERVVTKEEFDNLKAEVMNEYSKAFDAAKNYKAQPRLRPFNPQWKDQCLPDEYSRPRITGVQKDKLLQIAKEITTLPDGGSKFHPTVQRVYKQRAETLDPKMHDKPLVDFGFAEALAFGTLVSDGVDIRLMGQDVERGTFSHRHAKLWPQHEAAAKPYFPLEEAKKKLKLPGNITIGNSLLSEYACLGFEYGYSLESPNYLPMWEAQFGDFANGAQITIDQFIMSGESKWAHPTGITLMLPHGYDGQGSEHSSARMERFLQMCDDREDVISPDSWDINKRSVVQQHNAQVVCVSTPANLFHVLRRQNHRGFRKPLVVFAPKRLLRLKEACSPLADMMENTRFSRYISDPSFTSLPSERNDKRPAGNGTHDRSKVRKLVLCSGQVYYDLVKARAAAKLDDEVMISRIEQISPLPYDKIYDEIVSLPYLKSIAWCQEEPMNAGAWTYVKPRLEALLKHGGYVNGVRSPLYAGRDASAAPATGDASVHKKELDRLLKDALDLNQSANSYFEKYA